MGKTAGTLASFERTVAPLTDEKIYGVYHAIARACAASGLHREEAEDLAQDFWEWLLRVGGPERALALPWLRAVVRNLILRYRRKQQQGFREGGAAAARREPASDPDNGGLSLSLSLGLLQSRMRAPDAKLLCLIRLGFSFAGASARLGIPRGSRDYYRKRLREEIETELGPSRGRRVCARGGSQGPPRVRGGRATPD